MQRIRLEGLRFGRLLVQAHAPPIHGATAYLCKCDCGNSTIVRGASLRKGDTQSCGCFRRAVMAMERTTHGMYGTPTYKSYRAMLARCGDKTHKHYKNYGGRGITVVGRWAGFDAFVLDMGPRPPGTTLDRIDNDGNYSPSNASLSRPQQAEET